MPRTKLVTFDGASFRIAPLTFAQVEEYLSEPTPTRRPEAIISNAALLCKALNNAINGDMNPHRRVLVKLLAFIEKLQPAEGAEDEWTALREEIEALATPASEQWTEQRLKDELDPLLFWSFLPDEVLAFSGLGRAAAPPEKSAIPGSSSATSGVAS
jgi:hypothetical protein